MTAVATLSSKFQITIPSEARKALGLKAGRGLEVRIKHDRIELVPQEPPSALLGLIQGMPTDVPRTDDRF
jgi:AbrB family looped-hinge helix DNA binding protein